jgi:hypothetical protein
VKSGDFSQDVGEAIVARNRTGSIVPDLTHAREYAEQGSLPRLLPYMI